MMPAPFRLGIIAASLRSAQTSGAFGDTTVQFDYTGADQTWTVPLGITSARFREWGAGGASNSQTSGAEKALGGAGGFVSSTHAVTPGEPFTIKVGGGGSKNTTNVGRYPGAGGGRTEVRTATVAWSTTDKASAVALSDSNRTATFPFSGTNNGVRSDLPCRSRMVYFEFHIDQLGADAANAFSIGLKDRSQNLFIQSVATFQWRPAGQIYLNGSQIQGETASEFTTGDRLGIAFNPITRKVWVRKNGTWLFSGNPDAQTNEVAILSTGVYHPWALLQDGFLETICSLKARRADLNYSVPTSCIPLSEGEIAIAGGGGGGGGYGADNVQSWGGPGGGTTGKSGQDGVTNSGGATPGIGGSQSAGGAAGTGGGGGGTGPTAGSFKQGGSGGFQSTLSVVGGWPNGGYTGNDSERGGGGGDGWYGGGGGGGAGTWGNGGGGGSSYVAPAGTSVLHLQGSKNVPPGSSETGYVSGRAAGGADGSNGTNGLVLIDYDAPPGAFDAATVGSWVLSNADRTGASPASGVTSVRSMIPRSTKGYFELRLDSIAGTQNIAIGTGTSGHSLGVKLGFDSTSLGFFNHGFVNYGGGGGASSGTTWTTGDVVMLAVDPATGNIWVGKNGTWLASGDPSTNSTPFYTLTAMATAGIAYVFIGHDGSSGSIQGTGRFTSTHASYSVPTGYEYWDESWMTWSPSDKTAATSLSGGNVVVTMTGGASTDGVRALGYGFLTGKYYWEVTLTTLTSDSFRSKIGIRLASSALNNGAASDVEYRPDGTIYIGGSQIYTNGSLNAVQGDVIGFAVDFDANAMWVSRNGAFPSGTDPSTGTSPHVTIPSDLAYYISAQVDDGFGPLALTLNTGATAFAYAVPFGFAAPAA